MLEAALEYARRGWYIFPVHGIRDDRCTCGAAECPTPGKHPHIADWPNEATTDCEVLTRWWRQWPDANIGCASGPAGLLVLDIDPRHDGDKSLTRLEELHGRFYRTQTQTGGGGLHLFFRKPEGVRIKSKASALGVSYPGIDGRADKGCIILPPSLHVTGGRYEWLEPLATIPSPREMPSAPPWLIDLLREPAPGPRTPSADVPIPDGQRNMALTRIAGQMRRIGMSEMQMRHALRQCNSERCQPPLDEAVVDGIAHSVARYAPAETQNTESRWDVESAAKILRDGVPPVEFDIDSILPTEDGPAIVFGPPGSLKSWIALHAAACAATGNPFLGHFTVRRRPYAVYVNLDAGARAFRRRILRLGSPIENLLIISPDAYDTAALRQVFQAHAGAFVVIDTWADAFRTARSDDAAEAHRRFLRELRALYQAFGCNGFIIDHPHRPREGSPHGDYYGSIQKEAAARIMWHVTPLPQIESGVSRAKITCRKMSEGEPFVPFVARFDFNADTVVATYDGAVGQSGPGIPISLLKTDVEIVAQVLRGVPGGMSRAALQNRTGLSRDRVLAAVQESIFIAVGNGPVRRYALSESYETPNDPPDDCENGGVNRTETSCSLDECTNPDDSDAHFEGMESSAPPDDPADDSAA